MVRSGCGVRERRRPWFGPGFRPEPGPEPALGAGPGECGDRADAVAVALTPVPGAAARAVRARGWLRAAGAEGGGGDQPAAAAGGWKRWACGPHGPRHALRAPTWPAARVVGALSLKAPFETRIALGPFGSKRPALHPVSKKKNRDLGPNNRSVHSSSVQLVLVYVQG